MTYVQALRVPRGDVGIGRLDARGHVAHPRNTPADVTPELVGGQLEHREVDHHAEARQDALLYSVLYGADGGRPGGAVGSLPSAGFVQFVRCQEHVAGYVDEPFLCLIGLLPPK